jgi:hypothetical protein
LFSGHAKINHQIVVLVVHRYYSVMTKMHKSRGRGPIRSMNSAEPWSKPPRSTIEAGEALANFCWWGRRGQDDCRPYLRSMEHMVLHISTIQLYLPWYLNVTVKITLRMFDSYNIPDRRNILKPRIPPKTETKRNHRIGRDILRLMLKPD